MSDAALPGQRDIPAWEGFAEYVLSFLYFNGGVMGLLFGLLLMIAQIAYVAGVL